MNIGFIIGSNRVGGAERQVYLLCRGLHQRGIQPHVFFMDRPPIFKKQATIDFTPIPTKRLWKTRFSMQPSIAYLRYRLERENIRLLHMINLESMEYGIQAVRALSHIKTVGSIFGTAFTVRPAMPAALRQACSATDHIVCESLAVKQLLHDYNICPKHKARIIHNGIALPAMPVKQAGSDHPFHVLFVGSLKDVKNPLCFIEAACMVLEHTPDIHFTIAGDGPLRSEVQAAIAASACRKAFTLLGYVPAEQIPYADADILVSTSLREASPNAVLEALAHGRRVVGTAVGGTETILADQPFGMLVPPNDAAAVSTAILHFLAQTDATVETLQVAARNFIAAHYAIPRFIDQHAQLYRELCDTCQ